MSVRESERRSFTSSSKKSVAFTIDTNQRHELRERGGQWSEAAKLHLVSIIDSFPFACSGITLVQQVNWCGMLSMQHYPSKHMRVYGKVGVAGRMQMFVIQPVDSESRLAVLTEAVTVSLWIMGIGERYNQVQLRRGAHVHENCAPMRSRARAFRTSSIMPMAQSQQPETQSTTLTAMGNNPSTQTH